MLRFPLVLVSGILVGGCGNGSNSGRPDAPVPGRSDAGTTQPPDAPSADGAVDGGTAARTAIVFAAALDGQGATDLYLVQPDGTGLVRLTTTAGAELYPSWSPDHARIAYVRDFQLFVADADGRNERLLAAQTGKQRTINGTVYSTTLGPAAWSPDGTQLAYPFPRPANIITNDDEVIDESFATTIHFVNADGTNDRAIENDPGNTINSIAWAPNNTLSFSQADDCADCAGGQWYGFSNLDGSGYRAVTPNGLAPTGPNKHLDWSPDGSRWVYVGGLDYFSYDAPDFLYTSTAAGGDIVPLVANPGSYPHWSADGARIAYVVTDGIHVVDATRANDHLVIAASGIRGLDW